MLNRGKTKRAVYFYLQLGGIDYMIKAQKQPKDFPDDLAVSQYMGSMSEIEEGLRELAKNKKSRPNR